MHHKSTAQKLLAYFGNKKPNERQLNLMESILHTASTKAELMFDNRLTPRESECLFLACCGYSSIETADILKIGKKTVESYRTEIKKKLGCRNMIQAATQGVKYGYMNPQKAPLYPSKNTEGITVG